MNNPWWGRLGVTVVVVGLTAGCSTEPKLKIAAGTTSTTVPTTIAESTTIASTAPSGTTAPSTAPPTTVSSTPSYEVVDPPMLDGAQTDDVPTDGPLPDGRYWATYNGGDGVTAYLTLSVAYFGAACVEQAAAFGDECLNDIFVAPTPTRDMLDTPFAADAYVTVADVRTADSLLIDSTELVLASTGTPSDSAPSSYEYVAFPFIVTVVGGEIIGLEQLWIP